LKVKKLFRKFFRGKYFYGEIYFFFSRFKFKKIFVSQFFLQNKLYTILVSKTNNNLFTHQQEQQTNSNNNLLIQPQQPSISLQRPLQQNLLFQPLFFQNCPQLNETLNNKIEELPNSSQNGRRKYQKKNQVKYIRRWSNVPVSLSPRGKLTLFSDLSP